VYGSLGVFVGVFQLSGCCQPSSQLCLEGSLESHNAGTGQGRNPQTGKETESEFDNFPAVIVSVEFRYHCLSTVRVACTA
jgi:hypothetical protein